MIWLMAIETLFSIAKSKEKELQRVTQPALFEEVKKYEDFVKQQYERMKSPERRDKYFWIRKTLEFIKDAPQTNDLKPRTLFLNNYYALMRHWDDIADGDQAVPEGFPNGKEGRIAFIEHAFKIVDGKADPNLDKEACELADFCFRLGDSFGEDFRPQAKELLENLLYDAKRFGTNEVAVSKEELDENFEKEISGCAKATRKIFGEPEYADQIIRPLARAVQTYYTLRDFFEDVRMGIINISVNEMKEKNLNLEDLKDPNNLQLQKWFLEQAQEALALMEEYDKDITVYNLKRITRGALKFAFKIKAKVFLKKVVRRQGFIEKK